MIPTGSTALHCQSCGTQLARDNRGTICSPCRRTEIERLAHSGFVAAKERSRIKATFDNAGLYGVADQLGCDPGDALELLLNAQVLPFVSARRRAVLHQLVALRHLSHVDAAEALNVSRWTVATYRSQLGIERHPSSSAGRVDR